MRPYGKTLSAITVGFLLVGMTGCFSASKKDIAAFSKPHQVEVTALNYKLQPPDEIEVQCSKIPAIDQQTQMIRPDGKISFQSLGEFNVAGKTPRQVAKEIQAKAKELYALTGDNPIDVRVTAFTSHTYYIFGEVRRPGPKVYTGRDTLLRAIADAQLEITAWEERTQVIRPSDDTGQKPRIFEANLQDMFIHGDTSKNVLLQEGDIVYIPPTPLAAVGNVIAELVRPIGLALSPVLAATRISQGGY